MIAQYHKHHVWASAHRDIVLHSRIEYPTEYPAAYHSFVKPSPRSPATVGNSPTVEQSGWFVIVGARISPHTTLVLRDSR